MQFVAHIRVNGQKHLVLCRVNNPKKVWGFLKQVPYVSLKIRKSGKDGQKLIDEGKFLEQAPELLRCLLGGEVIKL